MKDKREYFEKIVSNLFKADIDFSWDDIDGYEDEDINGLWIGFNIGLEAPR